MRFNEKELALKSDGKAQMEGRLYYKKMNTTTYYYQTVFKEKNFKLTDNFLFYYRIDEKRPSGVFVLENASIQMEHGQDSPFAFSISFIDEPEKRHMFSGMTEACVTQWVTKLRCASYEYLRSQLYILQSKIYLNTGKSCYSALLKQVVFQDPLLMVPRNEGSMKWAPGQPMPAEHHLTGFVSHLSVQQPSSHVMRSKSFVNVLENVHITKNEEEPLEDPWKNHPRLGRSKTTAHMHSKRQNPFNSKEAPSQVTLRPAPSPPARKKNSPQMTRNSITISASQSSMEHIFDMDLIHPNSILSIPPRPPQRKNPTKPHSGPTESNNLIVFADVKSPEVETEDLIDLF